jgi:hypothetical protein
MSAVNLSHAEFLQVCRAFSTILVRCPPLFDFRLDRWLMQ